MLISESRELRGANYEKIVKRCKFGGGAALGSFQDLRGCKRENICYRGNVGNHFYNGEFMKKHFGFTLLITLGIIGVVAALTIPSLVEKHQKEVYLNRVKSTYSIVSNALVASVAENGDPSTWEYTKFDSSDPDYFEKFSEYSKMIATKYFKPYLKVTDEGPTKVARGYYLKLSNGVTLTFQPEGYLDSNGIFVQMSIFIIGSINGNTTIWSDSSRDYSRKDFILQLRSNYKNAKIDFYGTQNNNTISDIINHSSYGCNKNIQRSRRLYCGALLYYSGWQMTDDYPW